MRVEEGFQFSNFGVGNPWSDDDAFRAVIARLLQEGSPSTPADPASFYNSLQEFGTKVETVYTQIGKSLEGSRDEPRLIQYDAWGSRIDKLITGEGWKKLKIAAVEAGIVAASYPKATIGSNPPGGGRDGLGAYARLHAFARIVMFSPVTKVVLCPISMTDGATRVLELFGTPKQKDEVLPRLLSMNGQQAWTAGQWMTERPGGSDVSHMETTARPLDSGFDVSKAKPGDLFLLDGFKWFSSATDGDIALVLGRTNPDLSLGSRGISLFLVRIRDENSGKLNGIRVHRLKNKLGTRYLPTAELELNGCVGELIGRVGEGIKTISSVLNITRLYSAAGAVGGLGWGLRLCTAFAKVRQVSGARLLSTLPLHTDSLLKVTVIYRAFLQVFFDTASTMGSVEVGSASPSQASALRMITPALKAFIATRASESYMILIESMGGQGYMEENGLGEMLRDLTVERIWEGTPAVLALDVIRVLQSGKGLALRVFVDASTAALKNLDAHVIAQLPRSFEILSNGLDSLWQSYLNADLAVAVSSGDMRFARHLLDALMACHAGVLLLRQASWRRRASSQELMVAQLRDSLQAVQEDVEVARLWIEGQHGDIQRCLLSLQESVSSIGKATGVGSTDVSQRIVYASNLAPSSSKL